MVFGIHLRYPFPRFSRVAGPSPREGPNSSPQPQYPMPTNHPYDLVIGLDRSDRKADLHLIDTRTGDAQKQTVATSPEELHDWLARLRQDYPQGRVAICLEQPAAN